MSNKPLGIIDAPAPYGSIESPTRWHALPAYFRALAGERPQAVLLETSRFDAVNHRSLLFVDPIHVIQAWSPVELPDVFRRLDSALEQGCHVAGFLAYEAGYHFLDMPAPDSASSQPLAWFGVYTAPHTFDHRTGVAAGGRLLPAGANRSRPGPVADTPAAPVAATELGLRESDYIAKIHAIQELIARGETYQVNFTDEVAFAAASPSALYSALAGQQSVSYAAYLNLVDQQILSFSPELFFRIHDGTIVTQPMKGTMARGLDADEDAAQAERLRRDEKNRAEHVMIVDLLRNDLGRLCEAGSVQVSNPYVIERYQTLHQMTSRVSGRLHPCWTFHEVFASLFPCGSITGAPKISTMGIIRDMERRRRGAYTGAIGCIAPGGTATFSVAIRTLVVANGTARMGVGGGIVADSNARDEYQECLLKASFLGRGRRVFDIIETLKWQRNYELLALHLDRLQSSAGYFGFAFERKWVLNQLRELARGFDRDHLYRVRLSLDVSGRTTLQSVVFVAGATRQRVTLAAERTRSQDVFLRHKTTMRELYDRRHEQAAQDGFDDVLFMNERDEVTEGAISNLFVEKNGRWLTPPLHCGVLPGVFRRHLLETRPEAEERILRLQDIETADALYLCNSLRGLRRVQLATRVS